MNEDIKNLISQYDNFIYPKPVENIDVEIIKTKKVLYADPNFNWHILWPEKKYNFKDLLLYFFSGQSICQLKLGSAYGIFFF